MADAAVDWQTCLNLRREISECFNKVEIITNETSVVGWPQGPNSLFIACAEHCSRRSIGPWLWMETDAVPLHPEWADILAQEYTDSHKPVMGAVYPCNQPGLPVEMLSGIALYPFDFAKMQAFESVKENPSIAFDVNISRSLQKDYIAPTNRIQHFWGEPGLPPSFPKLVTAKHHFTLQKFQPNAIIFHRNKDGTLIDRLREQRGIKKEIIRPVPAAIVPSRPKLAVRRTGALGDVLAATCVQRKLSELGYDVTFQAHSSAHCILRRVVGIGGIEDCNSQPDVDLDGAYEKDPQRKHKHFAQMFFERANAHLRGIKIDNQRNFAPRMELTESDRTDALKILEPYPKPWVVIVPRSQSWACRTVPDRIWETAAPKIHGTKFWLALHPCPSANIVDLNIRHFDRAIGILGMADLVVCPDTGPMHVAAALGTPVVAIQQQSNPRRHLSEQRDFIVISPNLHCLNCDLNFCPINAENPPCQNISPDLIANAVNTKLQASMVDGVSCVICIYKPDAGRLNHCLRSVLPQVDEIVIVRDDAGKLPAGVMTDRKIRYLIAPGHDLGYGRKANHGFRHTNHKWVLLLNDDVYLAPDAVQKMRDAVARDTGIVAHELRYPDGTIQHGGTYRNPGDVGFGHLDWKARESRIKEPVELENVTGASILVRRQAFYDADGFDEDFYLYCEDNALNMSVRQAGWKIMYTPHAKGVHEESQSTSVTPRIHQIMQESHQLFKAKFGWYFEHNRNNTLGVFK